MHISYNYLGVLWTNIEACCPICRRTFTEWYCPFCGLPKKNSKYALSEYGTLCDCGHYHFRPEFSSFEDFQLCGECYTTNPFNAKYCRNCGKEITSRGVTKNAHGWIDLGLSVLWATETIEGLYMWNYAAKLYHTTNMMDYYHNYCNLENRELNDVATQIWGEKWRTPTKEEFEELVMKCKWEKCLDFKSNKHALKVTGPNGNSIILPTTGYAGCNVERDIFTHKVSIVKKEVTYSSCFFWTSTEDTKKADRAYAFCFNGYKGFNPTLTAREKKEQEFENERFKRKFESRFCSVDSFLNSLNSNKETQIERQREKEERLILNNMGDDSEEKADNIRKDEERRRKLWLETPVEIHYNKEKPIFNTIRPCFKDDGYAILPVADKKWQGKL